MSDLSNSENRDTQNAWARPAFLCLLIVATVAMRVVPHPWNFAPVGAVALFGGATFRSKWAAFLVPLSAMFISDVLLSNLKGYDLFTPITAVIYACYVFYAALGFWLRSRRQAVPIAGAALTGAVVFYLVTNLAAWWALSTGPGAEYTRDFAGLMSSYVLALPFFGNTLLGDVVFCTMLFGGLALAESKVPALRPESSMQPAAA